MWVHWLSWAVFMWDFLHGYQILWVRQMPNLAQSHGWWKTIIAVNWIFSQEYWREVPALGLCMSLAAHCRETGFQERLPQEEQAKESNCNLKASSDLLFFRNPWTSQQSIFLIQNSRGTDWRRRKPRRAGILERRIDMKAIFVNQLL